jgi:hypothetical protein
VAGDTDGTPESLGRHSSKNGDLSKRPWRPPMRCTAETFDLISPIGRTKNRHEDARFADVAQM